MATRRHIRKTLEQIKDKEKGFLLFTTYAQDMRGVGDIKGIPSLSRALNNHRLTYDEQQALIGYQLEEYSLINNQLRKGNSRMELIKQLDSAIARNNLKEDLVVWRGLDRNMLAKSLGIANDKNFATNLAGHQLHEKGYLSTSLSDAEAKGFGNMTISICLPKGTPVAYMNLGQSHEGYGNLDEEQELLLPRGGTLVFTGPDSANFVV